MPKPIKFSYAKKAPFRDAFFLIIICEGKNREPQYFRFFDGLSSRVKVIPIESDAGSSPKWLVDKAREVETVFDIAPDKDKIWFVIDTDRWRNQLLEIRQVCDKYNHWNVAQSNPCFEVWLYFHAKATLPELENISQCNYWKPHLPKVIKGGFNSDFHPASIEEAIVNAKKTFNCTGYYPTAGSTEVWMLAEELISFVKKDLNKLKGKFPEIEVLN